MSARTKSYQAVFSILFLLVLIYLLSRLKIGTVLGEISGSDKFYLTLGILSFILGASLKIFRFSLVTRYYGYTASILEASLIQMVGISLAIITPARVGEGSKAVLLNKRLGVPMSVSFGIIIFERFFDMLFLASGAFIFSFYILSGKATIIIGLFLSMLLALFIAFLRFFNTFKRLVPERYKEYFTDVKLKKNPLLGLVILITTGLTWSFEAGFPWLLARSMNVSVPYPQVFGAVCISVIAVVFSILPGGFGTMDLSFLILFPLIGVSAEKTVSILLIYRFFGILLPFLFSIVILNYYGMSFKEIKERIQG